ncbi:hypothetical protein ABEB36_003453 [Hypothenemus hampei]|uniref:Cas12f1-like TNB domain-containing protein n=1 Tax=Hypothenemus hampei TaxID=57062 RepID=A0ABD1F993_HYPHA
MDDSKSVPGTGGIYPALVICFVHIKVSRMEAIVFTSTLKNGKMQILQQFSRSFRDSTLQTRVSYGHNLKSVFVELEKAFHRRRDKCDKVEEFRTSRRCSHCYMELRIPSRLPDLAPDKGTRKRRRRKRRFVVCQNCPTVWNRDLNATRNIILVVASCVDYRSNTKSSRQIVGGTGACSAVAVIDHTLPVGL